MQPLQFNPGELILEEGAESDAAYRVLAGEVEIFTEVDGRCVVLGQIRPGEFLGEMGVVDGSPRSASARAASTVSAERLEKEEFLRRVSEEPAMAYTLIARLSRQLRVTNGKLVDVLAATEEQTTTALTPLAAPGTALGPPQLARARAPAARLTLLAGSPELGDAMGQGGLHLDRFPFAVGRRPSSDEPPAQVPIQLPLADAMPYRLSRQHFCVTRERDGYAVIDMGSMLGTEVDGEFLGRDFPSDIKRLAPGEHRIVAGGADSPFVFRLLLESA